MSASTTSKYTLDSNDSFTPAFFTIGNLQAMTDAGIMRSNAFGISGATQITNIIQITQAGYNAITPLSGTLYIITS